MPTLTTPAAAPGVAPAGVCDDCGRVLPVGVLRVIAEAEHWTAMAWDRGYVTCGTCGDAPADPGATDDDAVALAAATWQVRQRNGGDWTAPFPAEPTLAEELRLARVLLGMPEPTDHHAREVAYAALRAATAPPDGNELL